MVEEAVFSKDAKDFMAQEEHKGEKSDKSTVFPNI